MSTAVADQGAQVAGFPAEGTPYPRRGAALVRHPLVGVIARRIGLMIPTALVASIMTFLLVHLIPGGPAEALMGVNSTQGGITALNRELGLDHPLYVQYWHWLTGVLHGNFGTSIQDQAPVRQQIFHRLPVTGEIVVLAIVVSAVIAVPLGVWSASQVGKKADGFIRSASGLGLALPDFFLAILLIDVFAVGLHLLPELGFVNLSTDPVSNLKHVALPVITLAAGAGAIVVRQTRAAMVDALSSDYVRTAWAMGIRPRTVVWRYALRNVVPVIITVYGLLAIGMLGATIILEQVFVIPGLGSSLVTAIGARDYPMLQGIVLLYAIIVLILNLVVDVVNGLVSPLQQIGTDA
jgi:peptide/nickel transport system permease protein